MYGKKKTDHLRVVDYRRMLDELSASDVVWTPFEQHRAEPHGFSLFRGFLSWDGMTVPYMPDRCFRQFGLLQVIPQAPLTGRPAHHLCMREITSFQRISQEVRARTRVVQEPWEVAPDYLEWYASTSQVGRLLPLPVQHEPPAQDEAHDEAAGDESPPREGAPVPEHLPQWVHQTVGIVREALHSREIPPRTRAYGALYAMLGVPQDPPPPPQDQRHRPRRRQ